MNMSKSLIALTCTVIVFAAMSIAGAGKPDNAKCPMSGQDVNPDKVSVYKKVVGFCCGGCKGKFDKDPAKYVAKVKGEAKLANDKCPLSGRDVNPDKTVMYKGDKIGLCCGNCQAKFKADPDKFASKIKFTDPKPINDVCPLSGRDVNADKVSVYKKVVGFCCGNCQAKFDKNPDKFIAKVK